MLCKVFGKVFFKFDRTWSSPKSEADFNNISTIIILNHTSLFEPVFLANLPTNFLRKLSSNLLLPAAQETLQRPIVGRVIKGIVPKCIPISRKYDDSWVNFLNLIDDSCITAIMPEGRMKRRNGLDKHGNAMDIKAGVFDIIEKTNSGNILFVYSGGLHHVQAPGDKFPKLFKTIKVGFEFIDVKTYKASHHSQCEKTFKKNVLDDLQHRLNTKIPNSCS